MRYIRTKDGKVINISKYKIVKRMYFGVYYKNSDKELWRVINVEDIDREADTIEELCDEFVCIKQNRTKAIHTEDFNNLVYWKTNFKFKDECDFYGAIWTEKGLIYRAKMNEKGELELL